MKGILWVVLGILLISTVAFAQQRVRGYTTRRGTIVQPYVRTSPNRSRMDNWSTKGNVNPITGKRGTKTP